MLNPVLNKGGWGLSLARADSVETLQPILRAHYQQLNAYEFARQQAGNGFPDRVESALRTLRTDIGKIAETILSFGGVPYNGTDIDPGATGDTSVPPAERIERLDASERELYGLIDEGMNKPQQIRTLSTLKLLRNHSDDRLAILREAARAVRA